MPLTTKSIKKLDKLDHKILSVQAKKLIGDEKSPIHQVDEINEEEEEEENLKNKIN